MQQKHLFLYLKTGSGHLAPARSLAQHLKVKYNDTASVALYDGFTHAHPLVKNIIEDGYRKLQSSAVWLFEWLYAFNKISGIAKLTAFLVSFFVKPHLEKFILEYQPSHIELFHFLLIRPVMQVIVQKAPHVKVKVIVTDPFTTHPLWFLDKRPDYIVFSDRIKQQCIKKGILSAKCRVFPFILDEKFTQSPSQILLKTLRENLGFDPGRRLILILGGGDGMPGGIKILKNLLRNNPAAEIAIVCGNNHLLYKRAWDMKVKLRAERLKIFGYIDFVYEMIHMSDVVVTKCGASTKYSFDEIMSSNKLLVDYLLNNKDIIYLKGNHDAICPFGQESFTVENSKGKILHIEHGHSADFMNGTHLGRKIQTFGFNLLRPLSEIGLVYRIYQKIHLMGEAINKVPKKYDSIRYLRYALKLLKNNDVVILGHTHKIESHKTYYLNNKKIYINCGSCSMGRFQGVLINTETLKHETFKYKDFAELKKEYDKPPLVREFAMRA